ncbi:MAG: hypothetical protein V2I24_17395 [Halieaceae bacterium]|jgi:Asp-tRNA(Asn)/Glu-tRNA(Gln) amidotransferase A subunit family amidase|nr:hypothetical protein [Halieaceae bacterium]
MQRRQFPLAASGLAMALSLPAQLRAAALPAELTALSASQLSASIRERQASCVERRGRPMCIQCIGRMGEDRAVLEFALAYEAATGYLDRRPTLVAT